MTSTERTKAIMENFLKATEEEHRKALDELRNSKDGVPPWVQNVLGLIRRAQVRDPLYEPIVSVQPMPSPVGGIAFYRPRYGQQAGAVEGGEAVGKEVLFKVDSIKVLLWVLDRAVAGSRGAAWPDKKCLIGVGPAGERCAEFYAEDFRVMNGLGQVQTGGGLEVKNLKHNEGYEDFLLSLYWQSAFGWPTEMHVLGLAAYDGVEVGPEETV